MNPYLDGLTLWTFVFLIIIVARTARRMCRDLFGHV